MEIGNRIDLQERVTHQYRDGYTHLDGHNTLGTIEVLDILTGDAKCDTDSDGWCSMPRVCLLIEIELEPEFELMFQTFDTTGETMDKIAEALRDSLGGSSCTHEHDCCGCVSVFVDSITFVPRFRGEDKQSAWIQISRSRNY